MSENTSQSATQDKAPAFYNNPKNRAIIYQLLLFVGLGYFFYTIISNTLANMEARGIQSGFDFLSTTAGFDILMSLIPYDATYSYGHTFVVGLLNTILVSIIGIFFATIIGFIMGVAYFSNNYLIKKLSIIYVETFRNIPLLLQVFFWYFAVLAALPSARQSLSLAESFFLNVRGLYTPKLIGEPGSGIVYGALVLAIIAIVVLKRWAKKRQDLTGEQTPVFLYSLGLIFGLPLIALIVTGNPFTWEYPELKGFNFRGGATLTPEFAALVLALSTYTASFIAEIVRSGIMAINKGQTEAAYALGLQPGITMRLVIIPQALRVIIPPLTSQYLNLTKNSSLAAAIAYPDLVAVFAGTALNQTGQAVEIMSMTLAVYLFLSLVISAFMNWYNAKMALVER